MSGEQWPYHSLIQFNSIQLKSSHISIPNRETLLACSMTFGTKLINVLVARPYKKLDAMTCSCTRTYLHLLQYHQGTRTATRRISSTHTCSSLTTRIKVTRDVYYANHHKRNVLDIYESSCNANKNTKINKNTNEMLHQHQQKTVAIYIHGGLWMRGSCKG